jgi:plasmid stability protein
MPSRNAVRAALRERAAAEDRSVSAVVRRLLVRALAEDEETPARGGPERA